MTLKGSASVLFAYAILAAATEVPALESGARVVVRRFCQADGLGQRVQLAGWPAIAPLVTWLLEPAWDHAVLIDGYQVGLPYAVGESGIAMEVRYAVIGDVSALGLDIAVHLETAEFQMNGADGTWRILGPPPPPHIFASLVDVDAMRASLQVGGQDFLPNTVFVHRVLRSNGWNAAFVPTTELLQSETYRVVDKPEVNDLAAYLRDGVPYHVGVFEANDRIISSTLNAGVVRTAPDAFPGEMKVLRLAHAEPAVEMTPVPAPRAAPDLARLSPARSVAAPPHPTVSSAVTGRHRGTQKRQPSRAQPLKRKRVEPVRGGKKTKRPTPIVTHHAPLRDIRRGDAP
jgi:hypothetical protein